MACADGLRVASVQQRGEPAGKRIGLGRITIRGGLTLRGRRRNRGGRAPPHVTAKRWIIPVIHEPEFRDLAILPTAMMALVLRAAVAGLKQFYRNAIRTRPTGIKAGLVFNVGL
jgi:hypothetical protein